MTKQNDSDDFFQKQEVKDVLLERGNSPEDAVCVSEDNNGRYSREYLKWNLMAMWAKVCVHFNEEERAQWFKDNPEPPNKYE